MAAAVLASEIMDQSASMLNDTAKTLYSYVAQLPYLRKAAEDLELILIELGQSSLQRAESGTLDVDASDIDQALTNVPSNLFIPINVFERARDANDEEWQLMTEQAWEENVAQGVTLGNWTFRNNQIIFPPCSADREVYVTYWRQLVAITSESSNAEVVGSKTYLAAKTAELCARYIGENPERADALLSVEVIPLRDRLENIYVKSSQSLRVRRRRFGRH